jgi:protein-cysteine N-palmitoyltransferase HHAT
MTSLLRGLQRLYSLDTLDTRLTVSSSTSIKSSQQRDARAQQIAADAQPSRWNTPEFYFYYFVFLTVVPMMFKTVIDVSQGIMSSA